MNGQNPDPQQFTSAPQPATSPEVQQQAREFLHREPAAQASEKPAVTIPGGATSITESAQALFTAIAPSKQLFYRGGLVVELVKEAEGYAVQVVDAAAAQSRFEKYVRFFRRTRSGETVMPVQTTISEAIAKQYLKSEACRELLPKLNGIVHCPLLVEKDGQLHRMGQGYDETTGLFVAGGRTPESMSLSDAVEMLTGLLNDFDFVSPGDRARAIASFLTPALKLGGFIQGPVPVDVAEANASQAGKTYRQRMVAALYNQNMGVVTKRRGGVGSMEETFADFLVKGQAFIQFDNVRGKLDSQYLESFMTATGSFSARIPYLPSVTIDLTKFILFISSNGFEATKTLSNHASIIRIRKREGYNFRTLNGKDVMQLIFEWQPILLGCVFAVVEEWFKRGKPMTNETRHDFREWCQTLDWIVQNIFKEAPLMDGHAEAKERAANPQLTFLRTVAIKLGEQGRMNQQLSATEITDLCVEEDIDIPGLPEDNQTLEEGRKQFGRIMGRLFGDRSELMVDEFRVVRQEETTRTSAGNEQRLYRYRFSPVGGASQPPGNANTTASPVPA